MSDSGQTETDAAPFAAARRLIRRAERAALSTELVEAPERGLEAWPYASLVLFACDHDRTPILLMSELSEHSRNIAADPRLALLLDGTAGRVDPLTGPRLTLLGKAERTADERLAARFLARHQSARLYAGFGDFHFYRVAVTRAHFVAGFGRIDWLDAAAVIGGAAPGLAAGEPVLLERLNGDGGLLDALVRLAGGRPGPGWRATGIDAEGLDLRRKAALLRLDFVEPVSEPEAALAALGALAAAAKQR